MGDVIGGRKIIFHIDATNAAQLIPQLQVNAEDRQEIQNGIAVGLTAIVPQHAITINDWRGTGYILKDPLTSAGVYRLSGGLSGGSSTKKGDGFQIVELFLGPFAKLRDKLDIIIRGYLKTAATVEAEMGEPSDENMDEIFGYFIQQGVAVWLGTPYERVGR